MKVVIVPHDPEWAEAFASEARRIRMALGAVVVEVHHIGSTAIPGMPAKPIIDMLLEVRSLDDLDGATAALEAAGYEAMGEFGIPGRRYFRKDSAAGVRTHQIHAFEQGSVGCERHLAFRDYMIDHPDAARAYGLLKRQLVEAHAGDLEAYIDGKDAFVKEHEAMAIGWKKGATPRDSASCEPDHEA
ncbi:dephospho-CoA kinase [Haloferula helveola]|uniref:Dephospho-CoA kinase n=1 Tax=Haloferula helveola TaxID=490095 RepID=A0ABN6H2B7_9BACT|nr:dephospho-CoA kinase [Haloferula helveola]